MLTLRLFSWLCIIARICFCLQPFTLPLVDVSRALSFYSAPIRRNYQVERQHFVGFDPQKETNQVFAPSAQSLVAAVTHQPGTFARMTLNKKYIGSND